jgi:LytS/YehU family sensor histidine kinase
MPTLELTKMAAATIDSVMKTQIFLDHYGDALRLMRDMDPNQFAEELDKARVRYLHYQKNGNIEFFAMNLIRYEALVQSDDMSDFVKSLKEYQRKNQEILDYNAWLRATGYGDTVRPEQPKQEVLQEEESK